MFTVHWVWIWIRFPYFVAHFSSIVDMHVLHVTFFTSSSLVFSLRSCVQLLLFPYLLSFFSPARSFTLVRHSCLGALCEWVSGSAHVNVSFQFVDISSKCMAYFKEFKCHGADIRHVRSTHTSSDDDGDGTHQPMHLFRAKKPEIDWLLIDSDIDMMCRKVVPIRALCLDGSAWSRLHGWMWK